MNQLPVYATDLVRELDKSTPARCIRRGESPEDAHRYAGQRELVEGLLRRLEATNSSDPTQPLLGRS
jgi:hypothetical protein